MLLGDLLDQLRAQNTPLCSEAAEVIERLRAEVDRLKTETSMHRVGPGKYYTKGI